ncbi:guanine nucleotide-binding protein subunit beta-like protein 1 [Apostichopus japonicus]|uniref:guanine nucleotide-binding protein subunit beta-like protein 1 n=1 Tax=Stichopus japonicus TaxID=307972 RepID=UPI003AB4B02E
MANLRSAPSPLFVLRGSTDGISSLTFYHPNKSNRLLSGCNDGKINVWNLKSRRAVEKLDGHSGKGILTTLARKDGSIISHGRDGKLNIWRLDEGRANITDSLPIPCQSFCRCDLMEQGDQHLLASPGSEKSEVGIYDSSTLRLVKKLVPASQHKPFGMAMCLKFLNEELLAVGYEDGSIAIWDFSRQKIVTEKKFFNEPVMCFDFSVDLGKGICGSVEDDLILWTFDLNELKIDMGAKIKVTNPGFSDLVVRQDGRIAASAGWDSRLRIFGMKKLKPLAVLSYHTESVHCVRFSTPLSEFDDQQLLAAGSKDKHISVWSIYNG